MMAQANGADQARAFDTARDQGVDQSDDPRLLFDNHEPLFARLLAVAIKSVAERWIAGDEHPELRGFALARHQPPSDLLLLGLTHRAAQVRGKVVILIARAVENALRRGKRYLVLVADALEILPIAQFAA